MDDRTRQILETERAIGDQHARAWGHTIEPFFVDKEKHLFEAFCQCPTNNKEMLLDIKLQQNALTSLKEHFESFITTGQMAVRQLTEGEENG
jgi:hypothetical protein